MIMPGIMRGGSHPSMQQAAINLDETPIHVPTATDPWLAPA
jgi:hypothetical protein